MGALVAHYRLIPPRLWPWASFAPDEPHLACPCCGEAYLDPAAMDRLQRARDLLGAALRINSGHRCRLHNARVGGAPRSAHKRIAFDVSLRGHGDRRDVREALAAAGFTTFGLYRTFIHVDTRPGRFWWGSEEARRVWTG